MKNLHVANHIWLHCDPLLQKGQLCKVEGYHGVGRVESVPIRGNGEKVEVAGGQGCHTDVPVSGNSVEGDRREQGREKSGWGIAQSTVVSQIHCQRTVPHTL